LPLELTRLVINGHREFNRGHAEGVIGAADRARRVRSRRDIEA
jgi:hypothetical protein